MKTLKFLMIVVCGLVVTTIAACTAAATTTPPPLPTFTGPVPSVTPITQPTFMSGWALNDRSIPVMSQTVQILRDNKIPYQIGAEELVGWDSKKTFAWSGTTPDNHAIRLEIDIVTSSQGVNTIKVGDVYVMFLIYPNESLLYPTLVVNRVEAEGIYMEVITSSPIPSAMLPPTWKLYDPRAPGQPARPFTDM